MNSEAVTVYKNLSQEIIKTKKLFSVNQKIIWPAALRDQILDLHLKYKQSVNQICNVLDLPFSTVYTWVKFRSKIFNKSKFKEVKLTELVEPEVKHIDKPPLVLIFEKNGISFEVRNLSCLDLNQIIGLG
jgi:transposase-like protein